MRSWPRTYVYVLWVGSAGLVGATAGVPWIWLRVGDAPSVAFAAATALAAVARLARPKWRTGWGLTIGAGAVVGAVIGVLFGNPLSRAWVDDDVTCHQGWFSDFDSFTFADLVNPAILLLAAVGALVGQGPALVLKWCGRRWARLGDRPGASERRAEVAAIVSFCAGAIWTVANETLYVNFDDHRRDQCSPDIGIVGAVAYAIAMLGFLFAALRTRPASESTGSDPPGAERAEGARIRWAAIDFAMTALTLGALGGQVARSASLAKVVPAYPCECHQKKSDTPLRMF